MAKTVSRKATRQIAGRTSPRSPAKDQRRRSGTCCDTDAGIEARECYPLEDSWNGKRQQAQSDRCVHDLASFCIAASSDPDIFGSPQVLSLLTRYATSSGSTSHRSGNFGDTGRDDSHRDGQLCHIQNRPGSTMTGETSPVSDAFHPKPCFMAESGGTVLCKNHPKANSLQCVPERPVSEESHPFVS